MRDIRNGACREPPQVYKESSAAVPLGAERRSPLIESFTLVESFSE